MAFYVTRALESGPIRFGVGPRELEPTAGEANPDQFSTGPGGEFVRRGKGEAFFADAPRGETGEVGAMAIASPEGKRPIPWWGWVSIGWGALLVLLGVLVVVNKGYRSGWVEAAVGVGFILLPFVLTARRRREEKARRERERAEREQREAEVRKIAGAWIDRVRKIRTADDGALLDEVRREREEKAIPHESTAAAGRAATLRAGFDALVRWERGGRGVREAIDRVADAVGLREDERAAVRAAVFQRPWWHLLADDRMGPALRGRLEELRDALGLTPAAVDLERRAADEFERLRGVGARSLPKADCPFRLRPLETCLHRTRGSLTEPRPRTVRRRGEPARTEERWKDSVEQEVAITNQRLLVREGKSLAIELRRIWELEVDVDRGILALLVGGEKKRAHYVRLSDPIYTAGVIQAAADAPVKPKGLV